LKQVTVNLSREGDGGAEPFDAAVEDIAAAFGALHRRRGSAVVGTSQFV
jgi:hypothetical protein